MKEADIQFGSLYAIEGSGGVECFRVLAKLPPQPGKVRSRKYEITAPGSSYTQHIDASKILMPWAEYERTAEYQKLHREKIAQELTKQVIKAGGDWYELVAEYVETCIQQVTGTNGGRVYVSRSASLVHQPVDYDAHVRHLLKTPITIPIGTFVRMADIPIPDAPLLKAAIEQREEVLGELATQQLPALEAEVREALIEPISHDSLRFITEQYVETLKRGHVDGPHPVLEDVAKKFPGWYYLVELMNEKQFGYLAAHLQ